MTTLHGKEIKVGDEVWEVRKGWGVVGIMDEGQTYPITIGDNAYDETGRLYHSDIYPTLFWEEMILTPKPEPVYEWQWLYWDEGDEMYLVTDYSKEGGLPDRFYKLSRPLIRIEESKREVKP